MAWYRRFVVCWESFVPGGPIGAACWESFIPVRPAGFRAGRVSSRRWSCVRYKVLPASEKWLGIAVLWCVGRVLSRSSGETARSEGVRGLRGMYLRCRWSWSPDRRGVRGLQGLAGLRGDAPSEARGVDGERAGRPRAAREVWRGAPHGGLAAGCLADGERAGRRPPAHRADADNRTCWA